MPGCSCSSRVSAFRGEGNNVSFLQPGGEAGLRFRVGHRSSAMLSYGVLPYEMGAGVSDFLEERAPRRLDLLLELTTTATACSSPESRAPSSA